jgi:V/A-type H+-transporting ATPase subunit D
VGAAADETDPADLTLQWTTVMGVRCPERATVRPPGRPPDRPSPGSAATVLAGEAYGRAAQAAASHAAAAAAVAALEAEAATTRQRVRGLERHWIPRLEDALAAALLRAGELEDSDGVRRRLAALRRTRVDVPAG